MKRPPGDGAPRIIVCDLGSWAAAALIAEYDPVGDAIRVNVRAVELVRTALGDAGADRFVACAVAHESYHREHPGCSEAQAHAFASAACGEEMAAFQRVVRAGIVGAVR
jgi:hypothetical protein